MGAHKNTPERMCSGVLLLPGSMKPSVAYILRLRRKKLVIRWPRERVSNLLFRRERDSNITFRLGGTTVGGGGNTGSEGGGVSSASVIARFRIWSASCTAASGVSSLRACRMSFGSGRPRRLAVQLSQEHTGGWSPYRDARWCRSTAIRYAPSGVQRDGEFTGIWISNNPRYSAPRVLRPLSISTISQRVTLMN